MTTGQERRTRRATRTREGIVDAGADLFEQHGFFATTVEQIAERADVSPATVYAIAGGKSGILRELMNRWASAATEIDVDAVLAGCESAAEVIAAIGHASALIHERHGRTMRIILETAPHDQGAHEALAAATNRYRATLNRAAVRIVAFDDPRRDDPEDVGNLLWFYFGYGAWGALRRDAGWSLDNARQWLVSQATHALTMRRP
ncbi:TetR/AcrR family transcriptional regulator [Streptomyces sp. PT12]|uniref:TetR/AcrR family transcriptional regulator n=1 Tax=Streptomyces sp. PT12 TaxID=1510197 RepID=UPI000DE48E68|nr:TetR/AcrR family transcriptional regulator [Streptomyces sp. PT12]RBM10034.1 TetR/AcrR family transcriptional regulator [Streptomyces sp. PT12]